MKPGSRYTKPWQSFHDQTQLLLNRGLLDAKEHADALKTIGYYRLSGYWYVFRQFEKGAKYRGDMFIEGSCFADILALYYFDSQLRSAILRVTSAIEVAVRVQVGYVVGREDPFLHLDTDKLEGRRDQIEKFHKHLHKLQEKSHEDFVKHFKQKYNGYMPIWACVEIMQFGQLVKLFELLPYSTRKSIANEHKARVDEYLSWLKAINIVRNVAAHHGRIWNRSIGMKPSFSNRRNDPFLEHAQNSQHRIYGVLAVSAYLLRSFGLSHNIVDLRRAIEKFPSIEHLSQDMMGCPPGWAEEKLWTI